MAKERGLAMRILLYSPKDMIAGVVAFAACMAVIGNAMFLQRGPHPAPMFSPAAPANALASPLPRPRPLEADALPSEPKLAEPRLVEPRLIEPKPPDAMTNLVKATAANPLSSMPMAPLPPASTVTRPPAPIPPASVSTTGSRRLAAVQRALTEYGYGQLKPTGTMSADTQAAIQKFERERKLPVTGQLSERLVHELTVVTGHLVE
jgi:hypothetical protein